MIMFPSLILSLPWTVSLFGKEISSVARGLLWGRLCPVRRHGQWMWIGCRAQTMPRVPPLPFPLAPAKWAERWKGKLGFSCERHRCALWVTCVNLPLSARLTLSRKEDRGSPAHVGLWSAWQLAMPPTEWQSGLCATIISPYYAFFPC